MPIKSMPQNTIDIQGDKDNFGAKTDETVSSIQATVANDGDESKVWFIEIVCPLCLLKSNWSNQLFVCLFDRILLQNLVAASYKYQVLVAQYLNSVHHIRMV